MKAADIVKLLVQMESRFPVDKWRLDDMYIWPALRIGAGFQADDYAPDKKNVSLFRQSISGAKDLLKSNYLAIVDRANNASETKPADAVFLTNTGERAFELNGKAFNVYCDPIIDILRRRGMSGTLLEYTFSGSYPRAPRSSASIYIQNRLNWLGFKALVSAQSVGSLANRLEGFAELKKWTSAQGQATCDIKFDSLLKRVRVIRAWADYFKSVFAKIRPRVGFVVSFYGPLGNAFCLACREYGIPAVDIQHGVQGEGHCAYAQFSRVPSGGYELLPKYFWCWSSEDLKLINEWSSGLPGLPHTPIDGGNVLLTLSQLPDGQLAREFRELLSENLPTDNIPNVLLTLQPVNGLSLAMQKMIGATAGRVRWWIRLHPMQRNNLAEIEVQAKALSPTVEVSKPTALPLLALLQELIDVHVTEISSVVLEAESFAVPSVLLSETGFAYYSPQIARGVARVVTDPEKAVAAVLEFAELKKQKRFASPPWVYSLAHVESRIDRIFSSDGSPANL